MKFKDYRDNKIAEAEIGSHAECLAAMDCLMHHMNDEDEISCWLESGIPDNWHWDIFGLKSRTQLKDKVEFYTELVRDMTYGDYEACVMIFAYAVKAQCFSSKYTPRVFT